MDTVDMGVIAAAAMFVGYMVRDLWEDWFK